MTHLSWHRCAACVRLMLVPFGQSPGCTCDRAGEASSRRAGNGSSDGPLPDLTPRPSASPLSAAAAQVLTPEQDAIACRLLRQALPDGLDL